MRRAIAIVLLCLLSGCSMKSSTVSGISQLNDVAHKYPDNVRVYAFGTMSASAYQTARFGIGEEIHFLAIFEKTQDPNNIFEVSDVAESTK